MEPNKILSGHKQSQRSRVDHLDELLIVSDTTELVFHRHPSKEGLGDIGDSTTDLEGVKVHSTIGIHPQSHRMTGLIDQQALIEDQQAGTKHDTNGKSEPIQLESKQKNGFAETGKPETGLLRTFDQFLFTTEKQTHLRSIKKSEKRWETLDSWSVQVKTGGFGRKTVRMRNSLTGAATSPSEVADPSTFSKQVDEKLEQQMSRLLQERVNCAHHEKTQIRKVQLR